MKVELIQHIKIVFIQNFIVCFTYLFSLNNILLIYLYIETVQIQIEVLEKVYRETRRVAPMPKPLLPRIVTIPELFEHEESIALRSYLLPDGRDEFFIGQNSLLPAEGALIMTNYRLIFKGRPVNPASMFYSIVK
jgi:hypothetical protein